MTSPQDIRMEEEYALPILEEAKKDYEIYNEKSFSEAGVEIDRQSFIIGFLRGRSTPDATLSFKKIP